VQKSLTFSTNLFKRPLTSCFQALKLTPNYSWPHKLMINNIICLYNIGYIIIEICYCFGTHKGISSGGSLQFLISSSLFSYCSMKPSTSSPRYDYQLLLSVLSWTTFNLPCTHHTNLQNECSTPICDHIYVKKLMTNSNGV
jgi:hypothetical protein